MSRVRILSKEEEKKKVFFPGVKLFSMTAAELRSKNNGIYQKPNWKKNNFICT